MDRYYQDTDIKEKNIEVFVQKDLFKTKKRNWLKKFLAIMSNWNYKESIIISSALMDISTGELFEIIAVAHKKNNTLDK